MMDMGTPLSKEALKERADQIMRYPQPTAAELTKAKEIYFGLGLQEETEEAAKRALREHADEIMRSSNVNVGAVTYAKKIYTQLGLQEEAAEAAEKERRVRHLEWCSEMTEGMTR